MAIADIVKNTMRTKKPVKPQEVFLRQPSDSVDVTIMTRPSVELQIKVRWREILDSVAREEPEAMFEVAMESMRAMDRNLGDDVYEEFDMTDEQLADAVFWPVKDAITTAAAKWQALREQSLAAKVKATKRQERLQDKAATATKVARMRMKEQASGKEKKSST